MKTAILILTLASSSLFGQFGGTNAKRIQGKNVGSLSLCADGDALKWVSANNRFECVSATGGGDASTNTATSVDSEVVLFSGTSGKTLKRATASGVAKVTSGVLGVVSGTSTNCVLVDGTSAACGSGGGAPTGAQYLTLATDATLTAERVLTPDTNMSVTDAGAGGAYTFGPDTAKILSRATAQAGALRCAAADADDAYDCNMTPTLTAYTDGMVVEFEATVTANTGAATLQIDSLAGGGKAIKLCDGTTDPATGDIAVGKQIPLRYDGTVFRLPCNPATVSGGGSSTGTARYYYKAGQATIGGGYALGADFSAAPSTVAVLANLGDSWGGGFYLPKTAGNGVVLHHLLSDWTGSGNITLSTGWMWDGSGGGSGVWRIAVAAVCVAAGDAQVAIGSWNVVEATSSSQTNADRVKIDSINIDTTGCATGESLFLHLYRDGADGGDATTATARIAFAELSYAKNL